MGYLIEGVFDVNIQLNPLYEWFYSY